MTEPKFRVAIVGAGIGGLLLALSLEKFCDNIAVDIYESTAVLTETGAGIGVWPRVQEILRHIGLEDELLSMSYSKSHADAAPPTLTFRKSDQLEGFPFLENSVQFATYHRAHFQALLRKHLPKSCRIYFSKRLATYTENDSGEIFLQFLDGSTATCDVLAGCDGIKSTVRKVLYQSLADKAIQDGNNAKATDLLAQAKPVWSGRTVYRSLLSRDVLEHACPGHPHLTKPYLCAGRDHHVVTYPISQGQKLNVGVYIFDAEKENTQYDSAVWVRKCSKDEFIASFSTFEPQVTGLLNCLDDVSAWAVHTLPLLPTYVGDQVVLLGDAAHAMTPFQGSGAGQAMEDGFILASILAHSHVTRDTLPRALQIYDSIRRPFSQWVVQHSRATGDFDDLRAAEFEKLSDTKGALSEGQLAKISESLDSMFEWHMNTSVMPDRDRALELLNAME
ncbi:FAD/NAD(P)-binding domain-containing protein [Laetiporus sulphureus 93-53]|uniref:FAD/NAD(P)-binding domain-containing protein n=1 Tax=Laetiporus sulphureus 93-53 TaxID=1314785 RepID=A0A165BZC6_9APHY|nr:FAD/NAD(P)-binding domain-containing protein [Laetiporus sulphureus 93-53]KZT01925.1 FAD/NAD(P)-binding domain-containing protein [Laetiporus sulphureus 93-53]